MFVLIIFLNFRLNYLLLLIKLLLKVKWVWRGLTEVKTEQFFIAHVYNSENKFSSSFIFVIFSYYIPLFSDKIPILERKPQDTGSKEEPAVLPKKG